MMYAINWELSAWIRDNYAFIFDTAVQALLLDSDKPPGRIEGRCVLCIHLRAANIPRPNDKSPFHLIACDIEPRETVNSRVHLTKLRLQSDPCPGSAIVVRSIKENNSKSMLVYLFCDPVAFELCLLAPESVHQYRPQTNWLARLRSAFNPSALPRDENFFHLPVKYRPERPDTSIVADMDTLVAKWSDFYDYPLQSLLQSYPTVQPSSRLRALYTWGSYSPLKGRPSRPISRVHVSRRNLRKDPYH